MQKFGVKKFGVKKFGVKRVWTVKGVRGVRGVNGWLFVFRQSPLVLKSPSRKLLLKYINLEAPKNQ